MHFRVGYGVALCAACTVAGACGNAGSGRVTAVTTTGRVDGQVFLDANGNGVPDAGDPGLSDVRVLLVQRGTGDTTASDITDSDGAFAMPDVPVGDYGVEVDTSTVGDSVEVADVSETRVELAPGDSVGVTVTISYPFVTTQDVRDSPVGRKVFLGGVALNALAAFGDTTVHVADTDGAIRTTRVRQLAIVTGDSLRFLGRRNVRDGQPTLDDVTPFPVSIGTLPTAVPVTSGEALDADGGALDAHLVSAVGLVVADTLTTPTQDFIATADDGSGAVEVFFSSTGGFVLDTMELGVTILDITGLLVPRGNGTWWLKPRTQADVIVR